LGPGKPTGSLLSDRFCLGDSCAFDRGHERYGNASDFIVSRYWYYHVHVDKSYREPDGVASQLIMNPCRYGLSDLMLPPWDVVRQA
jgi:hypothetical protein